MAAGRPALHTSPSKQPYLSVYPPPSHDSWGVLPTLLHASTVNRSSLLHNPTIRSQVTGIASLLHAHPVLATGAARVFLQPVHNPRPCFPGQAIPTHPALSETQVAEDVGTEGVQGKARHINFL